MPYADTLDQFVGSGASEQDVATMKFLEDAATRAALEYMQREYPWLYETVGKDLNIGIPTPERLKKMFPYVENPKDYRINTGLQDLKENQLPQKSAYGIGREGTKDILFNLAVPDLMGLLGHEAGHKAFLFPIAQQLEKQFKITPRQKLASFAGGYYIPEDPRTHKITNQEWLLRALFQPYMQWGIEELGGPPIELTTEQKDLVKALEEVFKTGKYTKKTGEKK